MTAATPTTGQAVLVSSELEKAEKWLEDAETLHRMAPEYAANAAAAATIAQVHATLARAYREGCGFDD